MPTSKVTSMEDFNAKVAEAGPKLVVIDFYADWCGPCKKIGPFVEKCSNDYDIVVLKVDVDECDDVAMKHSIEAMPTFVFYKNGAEVGRFSGASDKTLKETIEKKM